MKHTNRPFLLLNSLASIIILPLVFMLLFLPVKGIVNIDFIDIASELSLFILAVCWIFVIRSARPDGFVTNLLILGLSIYAFGCFLDVLDEFFIRPSSTIYTNVIEKLPMPLGLSLLTYGLLHWRKEQKVINRQLQTREQYVRQYELTDPLTLLNDTRSFDKHIKLLNHSGKSFGLVAFDIVNFSEYNNRFGFSKADKCLMKIANLFCYQLRGCDLVCRFAGDRFIVLIKDENDKLVLSLAESLSKSINQTDICCKYSVIFPSEIQIILNSCDLENLSVAEILIVELNQRINIKSNQGVKVGEVL